MKIRTLFKIILYPCYYIYKKAQYNYAKNNPRKFAEKLYLDNFGRSIDWENPTEFNEKIRWMQFNTDTSEWSSLADKYGVREYLKAKGYEHILVKLYGKWDKANDIDFDSLPNSFILKTNHGYGEIIIVEDKSKANLVEIRKKNGLLFKYAIRYMVCRTALFKNQTLHYSRRTIVSGR